MRMGFGRTLVAVWALLAGGMAAEAHPHVFVDARAEIVFDAAGRIAAVRNVWQFDQAFTAFAVQGLDANRDGKLSDEELAPLAKVNVDSLKEFDFFTWLTVDDKPAPFVPPTEYWLEFHGGRLTLFYTLPLEKPVAVGAKTAIEIFDPDYFVAFSFAKTRPVTLDNAPAHCTSTYRPPGEVDARTMALLNALPADQPKLPPELLAAASVLANLIVVRCS